MMVRLNSSAKKRLSAKEVSLLLENIEVSSDHSTEISDDDFSDEENGDFEGTMCTSLLEKCDLKETERAPGPKRKYFKSDYEEKENHMDSDDDGVSNYQKMIQKNIAERMKFLNDLNIGGAKAELEKTLPVKKPKHVNLSYKEKTKADPGERRRSLRLLNVQPKTHVEVATIDHYEKSEPDLPDPGPSPLNSYFNLENKEDSDAFINELKGVPCQQRIAWPENPKQLKEAFKSMHCPDFGVAKVVRDRIFSIKVHPTLDKDLVFVGAKYGELGIWDLNEDREKSRVLHYNVHSRPINCLSVDRFDAGSVYSTSYDGSFRKLDLNASVIQQLYICDERFYVSWHAQQDRHCFLVSGSYGFLDFIDTRESKNPLNNYILQNNKSVKLVSVHPRNSNLVATGGADGNACLWDLRNMKRDPLSSIYHGRALSGLEFSASGSFLLSTSSDDHLRVMTLENNKLGVKTKIRHNNNTGRWLTTFRANWVPGSDTHFVVGSMMHPRRIEVWDAEGNLHHNFQGENLGSVSSVNCFHPGKRLLAGGNSSGKVFVFSSEKPL